jgi:polysaccharide export outer membrane protein
VDGTVKLPLIERTKVAGLTARRIEEAITKQLTDGYLKNPQVSVTVEQYKSQRVFVQGEVKQPGVYTLSGETTLLEILTRAGQVTPDAGNDVLLIRPAEGKSPAGPLGPDSGEGAETKRIDLNDLQNGLAATNVLLKDGDTIHVPRGEKVYIVGQVVTSGAYTIRKNTTVLQALALAGGVTERGARNRIKILRSINGKQKETSVELDDIVEPGDTIVVPERYF